MDAEPWLTETRSTYDKLAADYADFVRELLSSTPFERAAFALFADQVRAVGGGPVADVGCGTAGSRLTWPASASKRSVSTCRPR